MADGLNDLAIVPVNSSDTNYFLRKVTGLKIDQNYSFKFQWVFEDDTKSDWSPGYQINTPTENVPSAPSVTVPTTSTGSIPVTLSSFPANAKRVDIYVIGGEFGTGKVADYFLSAGTKSIAVAGGSYQVSLITVTPSGINGDPTNTFTINVSTAGETIQAPTNPNGFSIDRVLSGIQVNWAGTYANGTFTGFEAIKIYVGNLATATVGSYKEAGVMTGNNVKNAITIPVDGTYLRYNQPVYIHAAAVNKNGTVGTIQANVASDSLGARSAIASDLADQIISNAKLVDDAVTAAKIATSAITTTKIADDAITTPKLVANAITADKIVSSAITADKIATNAITAGKILAGTIDVTKLAAGTISVNNLEAGLITATSYIRAGGSTGARVELSSSNISDGPSAGFYIYNSAGTAILSAPLTGGLSITGGGSFTGDISGASGTFAGNLTASNGLFSVNNGILTAQSGTIGGWDINGTQLRSTGTNSITLNPNTPKIALLQSGVEKITIDPVEGIVGPNVTVAGNTGPGFLFSPNGTAVLRGTIYASSGIFSGTVSGATIQTSNSSYIRMDAASPSEIQLHANGFTYDGTIDFGGGTSNGKTFGSLVIQPPSNAPYFKPSISLDDASGLSIESYNKIYFSVSRPVVGTNDTSELNVFAYMEQYGAQGAFQGRFNFEANIPVADKSFRPIFAGTTSLPDAAFPNEEIGSIYLEY